MGMMPVTRKVQFEIPDSNHNWVPLPVGPQGTLDRVNIVQVAGSLQGYTWEIFDSIASASGTTPAIDNITPPTVIESHRVIPVQTVNNAVANGSYLPSRPIAFQGHQLSSVLLARYLYLRLTAGDYTSKQFEITYTCQVHVSD